MAFDTKYRPRTYGDVLGQDATADVLRQFVKEGRGFQQSYLFCGPHGSGKTTMGRILARALLCENPQEGEPCDQCESCLSILERGSSECFSEMDAATKSGKENITRITEEIQYSTFAGTRRVYLFDEAHRLSPQALDALLKPMEDEASPDTDDKQLVCMDLDGKQVWASGRQHRFGAGPYLIADGMIYVVDDSGKLTLAEATPTGYVQLAEAQVLHGHDSWGPLAMVDGKLILRDLTQMVCIDVKKK